MKEIKIFIGTSLNGEDAIAERTLKYSLLKHSTTPLDITFMRNNTDSANPFSNFNSSTWATPFSGLRWAIPEICNFQGRAIYMDVDQLNLKDITELFNVDLQGKIIGSIQGRTCIMVMDCEKFKEISIPIKTMKKSAAYHRELCIKVKPLTHFIDPKWNVLDGRGIAINDMWHLHFTSMPTQPWKPAWYKGQTKPHPRPDIVKLWEQYRDEAIKNGF